MISHFSQLNFRIIAREAVFVFLFFYLLTFETECTVTIQYRLNTIALNYSPGGVEEAIIAHSYSPLTKYSDIL